MDSCSDQKMRTENAEAMLRAIDNSGVRTFMYYPQTKSIIVPQKTCEAYQCRPFYENMPDSFAEDFVHPDDHAVFRELYERIDRGECTATTRFHSNDYKYCNEVTLTVISRTEEGLPREAFGIIENIEEEANARLLMLELKKQLKKKSPDEEEGQKAVNLIAAAIGGLYYAIYCISLEQDTFLCFREEALEALELIGEKGGYEQNWKIYVDRFVAAEYRKDMYELGSLTVLRQRLQNANFISHTYQREKLGWIRAQFIAAKRDENGRATDVILTVREVNNEVQAEKLKEQALYEAEHDPLTGLYNRKGFEKIVVSESFGQGRMGFALIDIDNFKALNDCHGHDLGDHVLQAVAERLQHIFRDEDKLFRIGGDELAILLYRCDESAWNTVCSKLKTVHAELEGEFSASLDVSVTLSVGLCFSDTGYQENMYLLADEALYETKKNGRAGCTLIGLDHKIRKTWQDDGVSVHTKNALEYKNSGMFRMEIPLDPKKPRRIICGESVLATFGAAPGMSPEECYEFWEKGVDPDYRDMLREAVNAMAETGQAECTYLWNHPKWGKIYVRSNGFGEMKDDMIVLTGYHHVLRDTRMIERKNDQELIAAAMSGAFLGAYYWDLKENTYSIFKASPGEDYMKMGRQKTTDKIREFLEMIVVPEDREKMRVFMNTETLQERLEREKYTECEYRSVNLWNWCRARLMPIRYDQDGKLTHVLFVISVLDSAKAQELNTVDYNKKSLAALFNNVPGGIVMYEWNGKQLKTVHISEYYAREYGYTLSSENGENKGGPDFKRVHPDDLEGYQEAIRRALTETHVLQYTYRVWNKTAGRYVWVKIDAAARLQPDGTSLVYAIYTDITAQKDLEQDLKKSRKSLTAALGASNQLCYEYDPVRHIGVCFTDTNFFGLPKYIENYPDSLKEADLFHPEDADTFIRTAHEMDEGKEKAQCDVRIKKNGEYCWYTCIFDAYYDPEREYYVAILTVVDISLRMVSMQSYEDHMRSLLAAQKDVLSMCTVNLSRNTFEMVNMEGVMEAFVDETASFETVMLGAADHIIGQESRRLYRETFGREKLLQQAEQGNMHAQMEFLMELKKGHYQWVTAAVDMIRNPISGEIGGIACSKSSQTAHMSNELLGRALQQDYLFAAVIFKDTDEFYLYDSVSGEFSGCMQNLWRVILTSPQPECTKETMEYLQSVLVREKMLAYLENHREFSFAYDSCRNGCQNRLEIKFSYLDEAHTMLLATLRNITDTMLLDQWRYDSEHDLLTGLLNRKTVFEKSRELLTQYPDEQFAMVHCDIRHFHLYNTFFGDEAGDRLLQKIAAVISRMGVDYDYWAYGRIESDVFCSFFPVKRGVLEKHVRFFLKELETFSEDFPLVPAIGAYWVTDPSMSIEAMFSRATIAAKSGKINLFGLISRYDDAMEQNLRDTQQITSEMQGAIAREQFQVYLQPKYSLRSRRVVGAEALVRWKHPERGMIAPGKFIPAFEKNGFITELDRYMWEHVCRLLRKWKDEGKPLLPISVNISRVSMYSHATVPVLKSLVRKYDLDPKYLELELTESAYMDDPEDLKRMLKELQEFGFRILMDDFGSGYSSLNTLRELPVDILKLDMKFLAASDRDLRAGAVLSSIVRMSKLLALPVIAEGVETAEQADYLRSIGCEYVQGYLFAKPMPVEEYEKEIQTQKGSESPEAERDPELIGRLLSETGTEEKQIGDEFPIPVALVEYARDRFMYLRANRLFLSEFELAEDTVSSLEAFRKHLSEKDYEQVLKAYSACTQTRGASCFRFTWNAENGEAREYVCRASYKGEVGDAKFMIVVFSNTTAVKEY